MFIPLHNCCPISVSEIINTTYLSHITLGLKPKTLSDIPCASIDWHLVGIHMLPNRMKTSTLVLKRSHAKTINIQEYQPCWPHLSIMQRRVCHLRWSVLHPSGACLHHIYLIPHNVAKGQTNHRIHWGQTVSPHCSVTHICHTTSSRNGRAAIQYLCTQI